jgi:hypothetical protein
MRVTFEWDPRKAKDNIINHGVSFEKATTVLAIPCRQQFPTRCILNMKNALSSLVRPINGVFWSLFTPTGVTRFESLVPASPLRMKGKSMKKADKTRRDPDMLDEYDFSKGIRGKYVKRLAAGSNVVVLSPDVAAVFPDSDSVNETLRVLAKIVHNRAKKMAA